MERRKTKQVRVGGIFIGGNAPVSVQGMAKVSSGDLPSLIRQVGAMVRAGAELVRIAVLRKEEAAAIAVLKTRFSVPLVADIHYDHRCALAAIAAGADKIRINPGNMKRAGLKSVVAACRERNVPLRIGINSGSIPIRGSLAKSMARAALESVRFFEDLDFFSLVLSLKTPHVGNTVAAYRAVADRCAYPLHLGVTEAGSGLAGEVKSVLGIGCLLQEGIGDTLRVSLTDSVVREILVGKEILQAAGLRRFSPEIISCPTCGRIQVDVIGMARKVKKGVERLARAHPAVNGLTIAVMGCSVNGPGEARQADIGIAGGRGKFALFERGDIVGTYPEDTILRILLKRIERLAEGKQADD